MRELSWSERGRLWLRLGLRLVLTVLTLWLAWKVGRPLLGLLMPFVVALVLTWILNPAIQGLEKRLKVRRPVLSMLLVVLGVAVVGAVLAALIYGLIGQVLSAVQDWQSIWNTVMSGVTAVSRALAEPLRHLPEPVSQRLTGLGDSAVAWLGTAMSDLLSAAATRAGSFAMSLPTWVVSVVVCVMATYFISADYAGLRAKAAACVPREFRGFFAHLKRVAKDAFGGYIKAELLLSVWVTAVLLVGFWIIGEPYGLLLAFVLAVMDFIPIIGAGTVMVPWAVIDVAVGGYRHAIELMVIWAAIILLRRIGEPKFVGDHTGLSPIASLLSIYVGMRLGGVVGMIFGPVLCLIALNILRAGFLDGTLRDLRLAVGDLSALLRNAPELPEDDEEDGGDDDA